MNKFFALLMAGCLAAWPALAQPKVRSSTTVQELMKGKLFAMNIILKGVVTEDFPLIQEQAQILYEISKATTWHKTDSELFLSYAKSFQNSAEFMVEQAKAKSLEGVAMGNIRLTLSCMECHNFVRYGRSK
jgi:hypothetical protein